MIRRAVLIGLSGTGKSTTSKRVAELLGWDVCDTDASIEAAQGRTIPTIFRDDGEAAFRSIESAELQRALGRDEVVIATGGGAVIDPEIWVAKWLGDPRSLVIWLDAETEELVARLQAQAEAEGATVERPLLEGDPLARFAKMRDQRRPAYSQADVALDVTLRSVDDVAEDIAELVSLANGSSSPVHLAVSGAESRIHVGNGVSGQLGAVVRDRWPKAQRVWAVVDGNVIPHIETLFGGLEDGTGLAVNRISIPPGEGSKSLQSLERLYDHMLGGGIERSDVVVAIGGGVVGDLAGFAAATVLRGVGLVQMPTTLLAMVDSSVGGKTAINHLAGKNLIGAFYQPSEVLIDPELLQSLPPRELRSGWGEVVKHGVIEPSTPGGNPPAILAALERNASSLKNLANPVAPWVIRRNVSLKAAVVQADERESGLRAILNFGHTIGHGVEAAGYSLLHGEAVSVGMNAAMAIAEALEFLDPALAGRIRRLLSEFGLPLTAKADAGEVRRKMASDKKRSAGKQTWILPVSEGGVVITTDIPEFAIDAAILQVSQPLS